MIQPDQGFRESRQQLPMPKGARRQLDAREHRIDALQAKPRPGRREPGGAPRAGPARNQPRARYAPECLITVSWNVGGHG